MKVRDQLVKDVSEYLLERERQAESPFIQETIRNAVEQLKGGTVTSTIIELQYALYSEKREQFILLTEISEERDLGRRQDIRNQAAAYQATINRISIWIQELYRPLLAGAA